MRSVSSFIPALAVLVVLAGCERRGPLVYVLESPQSVTLTASASASQVKKGETVVLRVTRRSSGNWKQISRDKLAPGQCWVYRPPAETEEVAHSVHWEVDPAGAVEFPNEQRLDQARTVRMTTRGIITLTPSSPIKCEELGVTGTPIEIAVS